MLTVPLIILAAMIALLLFGAFCWIWGKLIAWAVLRMIGK